ncbi:UNVERIFIED_CONTAM: putative membrane protein YgcG [Streptomyces canus]
MQDPGHFPAPDDTGSATEERFTYQAQAALRGVLEMLAGGGVIHVTCEHFEDVLVARAGGTVADDVALWDFQQIKSREKQDSWTLSKVLRSKALASLLRTHRALREHRNLPYVLTVGVEGPLSSEADVRAIARGRGGDSTERLGRMARHLDADAAETAAFLRLVRIEELPDRYELERRNRDVLFALAPHLRAGEVEVLHADLLNRVRLAMGGRLGPRWQALVTQPDVPEAVLRKRLTPQNLRDVALRLAGPDLADYVRASRLAAQTHPYPEAGQAGVASLSSVYVPQRLHRIASQSGRQHDSPAGQSPGDVADASALLGRAPMCLVLAGPGGGKSSLLRAVQADSAERWLAREDQRLLGVTVPATALLGSPLPRALAAGRPHRTRRAGPPDPHLRPHRVLGPAHRPHPGVHLGQFRKRGRNSQRGGGRWERGGHGRCARGFRRGGGGRGGDDGPGAQRSAGPITGRAEVVRAPPGLTNDLTQEELRPELRP